MYISMPSLHPGMLGEKVELQPSEVSVYDPPRSIASHGTLNGFTNGKAGLSDGIPSRDIAATPQGKHDATTLHKTKPEASQHRFDSASKASVSDADSSHHGLVNGNYKTNNHTLHNHSAETSDRANGSTSAADASPSNHVQTINATLPSEREHTAKSQHRRYHSSSAPQHLDSTMLHNGEHPSNQAPASKTQNPASTAASPNSAQANDWNTSDTLRGTLSLPPQSSAPKLVHRHTLEVPKMAASRPSRDFSSTTQASLDATSDGGRLTPTIPTPRGSKTLVRAPTRSINSDMYLDELPSDNDMARWADTVKQKRASRRRRKDDEEDDRVIVGTKVDINHVNWVTAYNMLTGIRFTVSRTHAKRERELVPADFLTMNKFSFDITGNELTPSAKYDFKFKDYAPWVFRDLRQKFGIDPADYLVSLTSKYILSELGSPGKSGSFFYFSRDYKYIIKTIHHSEHKLLRKILKDYHEHILANPNTLISQFYGLHRVKIPYGRKIHFVVMNNLFPPHRDIHQTFDLKGSTIGRDFKEEDLPRNPRATLKDLNWLRRDYHFEFGPYKKAIFEEQMKRDVALLQRLQIMDYSLLVGIHDLRKGNEEKLRDKTLRVFQPGGDEDAEPQAKVLTRTPSKHENVMQAKQLREIIKKEKPVPMDENNKMPEQLLENNKSVIFYGDDGGFQATHEDGQPGEEIYYLGIIDCLTKYGWVKRAENFWKGLSNNKSQISPIEPESYGSRFVKFISGLTKPKEAVERESQPADLPDGLSKPRKSQSDWAVPRRSTDKVIEKAEKQAEKSIKHGSHEDRLADRTLSAARSPSTDRGAGNAATLPVVQEDTEGSRDASPRAEKSRIRSSEITKQETKTTSKPGILPDITPMKRLSLGLGSTSKHEGVS